MTGFAGVSYRCPWYEEIGGHEETSDQLNPLFNI